MSEVLNYLLCGRGLQGPHPFNQEFDKLLIGEE